MKGPSNPPGWGAFSYLAIAFGVTVPFRLISRELADRRWRCRPTRHQNVGARFGARLCANGGYRPHYVSQQPFIHPMEILSHIDPMTSPGAVPIMRTLIPDRGLGLSVGRWPYPCGPYCRWAG